MTERLDDQQLADKEHSSCPRSFPGDEAIERARILCTEVVGFDKPWALAIMRGLLGRIAELSSARSAETRLDDKVFRFGADRYEGEQAIHEYCVRALDYDKLVDILNSYVGTYTREKERAEKAEALLSARSASGEWVRVPKDDQLYSRVLEHVPTISERTREVFLFTDAGEMWKLELPPIHPADRNANK